MFDGQGRRVYERKGANGFLLVVEGKPGLNFRQPGTVLMHGSCTPFSTGCAGLPDLQIEVSRNLGQGSAAVCDTGPTGDGVPGFDPPNFDGSPAVLDAVNDLACRFQANLTSSDACTKNLFGVEAFEAPDTTRQYCAVVTGKMPFSGGDTVVAVQLRDTSGVLGPREEIVVRVPTPSPTP